MLTKNAKFWVVRPRLDGASISGLETLVSGAFIAIDPGKGGGEQAFAYITGMGRPMAAAAAGYNSDRAAGLGG